MKKLANLLALALVVLTLASCEEKVQVCRAKVKRLTDTTVVATIDKYEIVFDAKNTRFANGALIPGDSAIVSYLGNLRDKKAQALIIELIPPKGHYMTPGFNPNNELKTAPRSEKDIRDTENFLKAAKKHGH